MRHGIAGKKLHVIIPALDTCHGKQSYCKQENTLDGIQISKVGWKVLL